MSSYPTAAEIEQEYSIQDGFIRSPGKFEGEPRWVPYFYAIALDGFGELCDGAIGDERANLCEQFPIEPEDVTQFPELAGASAVILEYDESGFVYGSTLDVK